MTATRPALPKLCTIAAALILTAATGCHKKTAAPVTPMATAPTTGAAPTAVLTADPLAIEQGQSVVLNWRTQNAESVTIDGIGSVNVNGTQTVSPSTSTNFHLVAKGDGGTTEANVRVTVSVGTAPTAPAAEGNADMGSEQAFHQNVQDVFFDYDSSDLRPDAVASTTRAAAYLQAHPAIKIIIGGYCDERGSAEYNLALGETRANAARTALVNGGVAASRVRVVSFGKEKQFCSEQDESCYQQNRRGQFSLDR